MNDYSQLLLLVLEVFLPDEVTFSLECVFVCVFVWMFSSYCLILFTVLQFCVDTQEDAVNKGEINILRVISLQLRIIPTIKTHFHNRHLLFCSTGCHLHK
jgi:hypothetical protein